MPAQSSLEGGLGRGLEHAAAKYRLEEVVSRNEWQIMAARAAASHMTQTWAFGEAKRALQWQPYRLLVRREGEPVAVCQALCRAVAGIPMLTRINHGPLMLADHADEAMDVLRAIRRHWRHFRRGFLLIAPAVPYSGEALQTVLEMGFHRRGDFRWASSRLDLTLAEDDLRTSLTGKWRNRLRKSEQHGLEFVAGNASGDVEWILCRHLEHIEEKGFAGPAPALIRALHQAAPTDFLVFRAAYRGTAVAGMAAYRFGDVAQAYIAWNGQAGRQLNAGNFLFWNAALELKRRGCRRFDLGGHNDDSSGFGAFKRGMNGAGYQLLGEFICA